MIHGLPITKVERFRVHNVLGWKNLKQLASM
jgi:hypothetical protein